MKSFNIFAAILILIVIASIDSSAQMLNIYEMIGKSKVDVIKKYGKPAHLEDNEPAYSCMFYKAKNYYISFVADNYGVFQANGNVNYGSESEARNVLNDFILKSAGNGFTIDTVSTTVYNIHKPGVAIEIRLLSNQSTNKFILNIDAKKSAL